MYIRDKCEYCKVGTHVYCNFWFAWGYCRVDTHAHCDFWFASEYCMVNTMHNVLCELHGGIARMTFIPNLVFQIGMQVLHDWVIYIV